MMLSRRRLLAGVGLGALGGLLAGCGARPAASAEARSRKARERDPQVSPPDLRAYAAGHNAFGLALFGLLRRGPGNLFFSPYSLAQALTQLSAGARGATAQQLAQTLRAAFPQARLHSAANALDQSLAGRGQQGFRLDQANSLWGQRDHTFRPELLDLLATNYGAGLRLLDFERQPEPARAAINAAVAQQTQDAIQELLPPGSITARTRLVLANAIAFSARWVSPFPKPKTGDGPFTLADGSAVTVPLMHQRGVFRHTAQPDYQAVSLPYHGDVSMLVLLPPPGGLDAFERGLSPERLQAILESLKESELILTLPRFAYRPPSASLRAPLEQLGISDAFDMTRADLSGLDGTSSLYVSDLYHQGLVRVDEEGTEAAAASGVVMELVSAPPSMTVDRPFVFAIRDDDTGALLFLGRVANPAAAG